MGTGKETHLNVLYLGEQTAFGSPVTPNVYIVGVTDHKARHETNVHRPEEYGLTGPTDLVQMIRDSVQITATIEPVYDQLQYFYDMLFGKASPSGTGPYERTWVAPVTSTVDPMFTTVGRGQSGFFYTYPDVAVKTMDMKFSLDNGISMDLTMLATSESPGTFTAIARPTGQVPLPVLNTQIYLDLPTSSPGTTLLPATIREFTVHTDNGLHYKHFPGSVAAQGWGTGRWEVYIDATLEMTPNVVNLYNDVITSPPDIPERWVKIAIPHGSDYEYAITLFATVEQNGDSWDDADGNVVWNVRFNGAFAPSGNWYEVYLKNNAS